MKKLIIIVTASVLLSVGVVNAQQQQVSEKEAKNAAINVLYNKSEMLSKSSDTEIDIVHSFSNNRSNVLMYEVVFKNGTAVLLSGSKACLPVLGYYTKPEHDKGSIFDTANMNVPCCLRAFLYDYIQELESSFAQRNIELHYDVQWEELQQSNLSRANPPATITVQPLLKTKWGQHYSNDGVCDAYNHDVTDTYSGCGCSSKRCPAGCTAVAMAQIMKYWNYPVYLPNQDYQYDWCNMPYELNYYSNPNYEIQRNAIARLIKDCGTKANMEYCSSGCGSGASESDARDALVNDFGYSSDADHQRRFWWSDNVWKGRIKANLNQSRPVFYSGFNNESGHAFVCDGYGSDDLFHFNWGWSSGYYETWFTIDNINPASNYNSSQHAIFYIHPNSIENYCNYSLPLWTHYYMYYNVLGNTFPPPYMNVPQTFTKLESVPEGNGFPTSWHTIEAGEVAIYTAHKEIRLRPGFRAKAGSYFRAHIEPCYGCNEMQSSFLLNNPANEDDISEGYNNVLPLKQGYATVSTDRLPEEETATIRLYPNPNSGTFSIVPNFDPQEIKTVQIYNSFGQLIHSQQGLPQATLTISALSKGLFMVKITAATNQFILKMVVQ